MQSNHSQSKIKKLLTKLHKRRIISKDGVTLFSSIRKQFRIVQRALTGSVSSISLKFKLPHGRKERIMKFMSKTRNRFAIASLLTGLTLTLIACGGGGGGTVTPTSVTKTITCPNGTSKSGTGATDQAALDAAMGQCAAAIVLSVTPADKLTVSPPSVIATTTDSLLDQTSVTAANVSLKAGTVTVPGTVAIDSSTKGFTFTPSAKLLFGQAYSFAASLKDSLGKAFAVSTTFTTSAVSCTTPQVPAPDGQSCVTPVACMPPSMLNSSYICMPPPAPTGYTWNVANKVWVADIGTLVTGLNTLPAECVTIGDACWKVSSANGTIKYFGTGLTVDGRKFIFAGYIIGGTLPGAGSFAMKTIYFDTEAATPGLSKGVNVAYNTSGIVNAKGSVDGVKYTTPTNGCWEFFYTGSGTNTRSATCPI